MPLSDQDVQKQIQHMMAFIDQEANEKAEEIDAKAEEEFNIEKGRLVQQQRMKIMEFYERKEKQVELQKKIQNSNLLNQARLKILKAREEHIQNVIEDARCRLVHIANDKNKYKAVLLGLISQGLCKLGEDEVSVQCRQEDLNIVRDCLPAAINKCKELIKKDVKASMDTENFLGSETSGGVILLANKGKIKVVNTLDKRLELMSGQMLPEIRNSLFGSNPNRKFFD
ncbi:V-type proton ATPase subunit E-like [Tubulanus polymorphus]|uniref:V-type proton ATPase subunit E-like n=1 Tax=Tubulanus polymorphus TaxID=672921 RepID=UPI003DA55AB4